jgi:hypothetical protein
MKVLITGARYSHFCLSSLFFSGFLGGRVLDFLLEGPQYDEIRVFVRPTSDISAFSEHPKVVNSKPSYSQR